MEKLKEYAFHMVNKNTNEERVKKVKADSVNNAHCNDVGYGKNWRWTGTEPWHNVVDNVEHIGNGYYKKME